MLKNFYIFRNGQSSHNLAGRLQGQSNNSVLTDTGISQAISTADFLKDKQIDVIMSSPQRRAKQTGSIVAKRLKTPIYYDSRLIEANIGRFDGALINKLSQKHRQTLFHWHSEDSETARFEHGESKQELRSRLIAALKQYADSPCRNIAISSHNFSILEILQSLHIQKDNILNGEIIHLQYDGSQWNYIQQ